MNSLTTIPQSIALTITPWGHPLNFQMSPSISIYWYMWNSFLVLSRFRRHITPKHSLLWWYPFSLCHYLYGSVISLHHTITSGSIGGSKKLKDIPLLQHVTHCCWVKQGAVIRQHFLHLLQKHLFNCFHYVTDWFIPQLSPQCKSPWATINHGKVGSSSIVCIIDCQSFPCFFYIYLSCFMNILSQVNRLASVTWPDHLLHLLPLNIRINLPY